MESYHGLSSAILLAMGRLACSSQESIFNLNNSNISIRLTVDLWICPSNVGKIHLIGYLFLSPLAGVYALIVLHHNEFT